MVEHQTNRLRPSTLPLIIAHRGACGDRPEHGLSAHRLAIEQGAEVIEPDLVFSADGELLVRHDLGLARSTDIADHAEFLEHGLQVGGSVDWLAADLSWEQIQRLSCRQPWPQRPQQRNNVDCVLRLQDLLKLARAEGRRRNRKVVVYAETKQPQWHRDRGHDFVASVVKTLDSVGQLAPHAALWMQSFEWDVLDQLRARCGLPGYALIAVDTPFDAAELAVRFDGVGIAKQRIDPRTDVGRNTLESLQSAGLKIHAWTFRYDLPGDSWPDTQAELAAYLGLGLDGLFCDFPGRVLGLRKTLAESA